VAAFVIDENGHVEFPTISLVQPVPDREFFQAVCDFLHRASFDWQPHEPARGLVIMPFEFTLGATRVTRPIPGPVNLEKLRGELSNLTPLQLADWVQSRPHCR
jgi:hypothetical protein